MGAVDSRCIKSWGVCSCNDLHSIFPAQLLCKRAAHENHSVQHRSNWWLSSAVQSCRGRLPLGHAFYVSPAHITTVPAAHSSSAAHMAERDTRTAAAGAALTSSLSSSYVELASTPSTCTAAVPPAPHAQRTMAKFSTIDYLMPYQMQASDTGVSCRCQI